MSNRLIFPDIIVTILKVQLLVNILTFDNLMPSQNCHCTSWYFKNHSQVTIDSSNFDFRHLL